MAMQNSKLLRDSSQPSTPPIADLRPCRVSYAAWCGVQAPGERVRACVRAGVQKRDGRATCVAANSQEHKEAVPAIGVRFLIN